MSKSIREKIVDDFIGQIEQEGVIASMDLEKLKSILLSGEKIKKDDVSNFILEALG
jgi:hypothetical protein